MSRVRELAHIMSGNYTTSPRVREHHVITSLRVRELKHVMRELKHEMGAGAKACDGCGSMSGHHVTASAGGTPRRE